MADRGTYRRYMTLLAAITCAALLTGCAGTNGSVPTIITNKDPAADFDRFRTFAFVQPLGTDRRGTPSSLSVRLRAATTRELTSRGLSPVSSSPDLLVNFLAATDSRSARTNAASQHGRVGYATWRGYPMESSTTRVITEGAIAIDIVDARTGTLVWEGAATGRLTEGMRDDMEATVNKVVAAILAEFP